MGTIGIIFISIYFIISIAIGIWASRKETPEGFLLGDRKVGSFSTFATLIASKIGGGFFLMVVAFVYLYGAGVFWYTLGVVVGLWAFYIFAKTRLKPQSDEHRYYTLADYIFKNQGKSAGYLAALLTFLILSSVLTINLVGGSKALNEIAGFGYNTSLLVMAVVVLIYLLAGGFKAVVKTDIFQCIVIFLLSFIILFALIGLWKIDLSDLNIFSTGLVNIAMFVLLGILTPFYQSELYQRVYATKDRQTLKKGFILSMILLPLLIISVVIIGVVIKGYLPEADPEIAFIKGLIELLPAVLMGLGGVLMFSAIMSSVDTFVFTNTSVFLQDFVLRGKKISREKLVKYFRIVMVFVMFAGVISSYLLRSVIISSYLWVALGIILGTGMIATWIFKKLSNLSLSLGFVFGLAIFSYVVATNAFTPLVVGYSFASTVLGLVIGSIISKFSIKKKV